MNTRPTPETDKFFATFADGEYAPSHAEYYVRLQDLELERDHWKALATKINMETTQNPNSERGDVRSIDCSAWPVYSKKPEVEAIELLDGAYDIIEIWKAESPAQIAWKRAWLAKAKELGAKPSW